MSRRDPGLRLAEPLPPTLVPNAVLLAAPRPDRMLSLLAAGVLYVLVGMAVAAGARRAEDPGARPTTRGFDWVLPKDGDIPPAPPVARPAAPPDRGLRPAGFKAVEPPADSRAMPEVAPDRLPVVDRSLEAPPLPESSGTLAPAGYVPGSAPAPPAPAGRGGAPLEVDVRAVRILRQVQPEYPALARMARKEGPVELRLTIDAQGIPTEIQVISGPHPLLIQEAVRVARLWRFQPATVDGVPVSACFTLTVGFRLSKTPAP